MNKVDIIEIINRCPRKLSLYVSVLGKEVDNYVIDNDKIEIPVNERLSSLVVCRDGTLFDGGECILFPSSKHRTWKHWQRELFKEGDKIIKSSYQETYHEGQYTWEELDKYNFVEIIRLFMVGYIITPKNNKERDPKLIYTIKETQCDGYLAECITGDKIKILYEEQGDFEIITPLKPFDKILVRNTLTEKWICAFYSGYSRDKDVFISAGGNNWIYCLPYNGNESLIE